MDNCNNVQQECGLELARPYVNRQIYNETYDSETALKKGTLFPELYLVESNNYNAWLYENPMNRVK
ncbi:MAG: spore coat associated protein CotJA [Romboutsia sp.]|nr:spore coat associated protein CotJA [Romboutsia sp.]